MYVRARSGLLEAEPVWLEGQRRLPAELGGRYAEITGADVAMAILDFAHAEHAAQVVLGSTRRTRAYEALDGSVIGRIISRAGLIEVHVVRRSSRPKDSLTVPEASAATAQGGAAAQANGLSPSRPVIVTPRPAAIFDRSAKSIGRLGSVSIRWMRG